MFLNALDVLLLSLGIGTSIYYRRLRTRREEPKFVSTLLNLGAIVLFGFILPYIAIQYEEHREVSSWTEGSTHDGFELLYVIFRFPTYWLALLVILLINNITIRNKALST